MSNNINIKIKWNHFIEWNQTSVDKLIKYLASNAPRSSVRWTLSLPHHMREHISSHGKSAKNDWCRECEQRTKKKQTVLAHLVVDRCDAPRRDCAASRGQREAQHYKWIEAHKNVTTHITKKNNSSVQENVNKKQVGHKSKDSRAWSQDLAQARTQHHRVAPICHNPQNTQLATECWQRMDKLSLIVVAIAGKQATKIVLTRDRQRAARIFARCAVWQKATI